MAMVGRGVRRGQAGDGDDSDRSHQDVFPALGAFVSAGVVLGVVAAGIIDGLMGRGGGDLVVRIWGAGLGAILGLFVSLNQGVWRPGRPLPVREPEREPEPERRAELSPQLWDPWVDSGRDVEWVDLEPAPLEAPAAEESPGCVVVEGADGVTAEQARVRPRVVSPDTGEAILLEEEIGSMIQAGRGGLVAITGGPGSGKTTALGHLAAILPPWARDRVRLIDQPDHREALDAHASDWAVLQAAAADRYLVIVAPRPPSRLNRHAIYRLASWGQDDLIEYLLTAHRENCASVMTRLKAGGDGDFLEGIPELWTVVLDRMARDESVDDVRTALRCELAARFDDLLNSRERIEDFCLTACRLMDLVSAQPPVRLGSADLIRLVRHKPAQLLLAADRITEIVTRGHGKLALTHRLPRALIQEAARQITGNARALQHLNEWVGQGPRGTDRPLTKGVLRSVQPMAVSLLHAATPGWRPNLGCVPRLEGAYLEGVAWPGLILAGVNLCDAELRHADLNGANLEKAHVKRTRLHRADLQAATLCHGIAIGADLSHANLTRARARHAQFRGANLAGASFIEADLWKANLREANIEDADFTGANLEEACLSGLKLRLARFGGARFGGAELHHCDLEDMKLVDADFHGADLCGALLTGTQMPGANFVRANLRNAGLAEVDWPGANLRGADLRGATFHLGSSRSGLVGSPIACEGSRTGFYTDDYHEQDVKPAEAIRKANLRGADLRGAEIQDVDFYLVDLRNAKYTPDQATHFRRCRAILDDRTA
jgi:uncharacterized protein YjbI with pentapeptide repeats/energy-coupling factor transporter ATP-binding protein EcfA2